VGSAHCNSAHFHFPFGIVQIQFPNRVQTSEIHTKLNKFNKIANLIPYLNSNIIYEIKL
jgi:hypothetical protein